ncbi:MAG: class II aldolase/adducin family protein [Candidatus Margulisbacteria bacterium]|nr:class II aldolase/adducin family protein [Candidatus Margulisiibacteriota bacterium]
METPKKVIPKFKVDFIGAGAPHDQGLEELKRWCSIFHKKDLAPLYEHGSFGNLSFRIQGPPGGQTDQFIITASGLKLKDDLTDDCFVKVVTVDLKQQLISAAGSRLPSSETMLHAAIYQDRRDVNAVFHGHSQAILKCRELTATQKEEPYGSRALVESVLPLLADNDFIIMKNHGFLSLGATMKAAGEKALEVLSNCS